MSAACGGYRAKVLSWTCLLPQHLLIRWQVCMTTISCVSAPVPEGFLDLASAFPGHLSETLLTCSHPSLGLFWFTMAAQRDPTSWEIIILFHNTTTPLLFSSLFFLSCHFLRSPPKSTQHKTLSTHHPFPAKTEPAQLCLLIYRRHSLFLCITFLLGEQQTMTFVQPQERRSAGRITTSNLCNLLWILGILR